MNRLNEKYYLFSIDLEDVRDMIPNGYQYKEGVVSNTLKYLDWLDAQKLKCTFFVVGRTAESFPDLIREIINRGHETACHTHQHIHLTKLTEKQFAEDLDANITALQKCGATSITGFRAPTFSMVESSRWAYRILKEAGIKYSSSVIPNSNPIFGWKHFGKEKFVDDVFEIPMNIGFKPFAVPFGGGVYFRCLPLFLLRSLFNQAASQKAPVLGYFHPYDVNTEQEHFMHPHLNDNFFLNELMYINRKKVFNKLDRIIESGFRVIRYDDYYKLRVR